MSFFTSNLLGTYLIFPILALLMIGLGALLAKKAELLSNKKYVVYCLLAALVLAAPGLLGVLDYDFMPFGYIGLCLLYAILGYYNLDLFKWVLGQEAEDNFAKPLLTTIFLQVVGMLLFSLLFNLVNELQYGAWASTPILLFIFPLAFRQTYRQFLLIPIEIYKIWKYNEAGEQQEHQHQHLDYDNLRVVEIELFRNETDPQPIKIKVKAPDDMPFGAWFRRMLYDYNLKSPQQPIEYMAKEGGAGTGWIFYVKPSLLLPRRYLDYDGSFHQNKIKERHTIIAKRVKEIKQ